MGLIRERHNRILARLVKATPSSAGERIVEQAVPGDPTRSRPDLVIVSPDKRHAMIVDVTIPFEGEENALEKVKEAKESKYRPLAEWMQREKGYTSVQVHAFIVGALGSWDPGNEEVLGALGIRRNYSRLFRHLCVISAIQGSREIWAASVSRPR